MRALIIYVMSLGLGAIAFGATPTPSDLQKQLVQACEQPFSNSSQALIEQLLAKGADLNKSDVELVNTQMMGTITYNKTCLGTAVARTNANEVQFLLNKGALVLKGDVIESIPNESLSSTAFDLLETAASQLSQQGQSIAAATAIDNLLAPAVVRELKAANKPIDSSIDRNGDSALSFSVAVHASQAVQSLINSGANVNATSRDGYTPLSEAILNDDVATARVLLKNGANARCMSDASCPLMTAVWSDDVNMVNLLVQFKANPQAGISGEESILDRAARSANPTLALIQALVNAGANPNSVHVEKDLQGRVNNDITPLLNTISGIGQGNGTLGERPQIVQYLLQVKKVNPNQGCEYSMTPLGLAKFYKEAPIVSLLTQAGANPNQTACVAK